MRSGFAQLFQAALFVPVCSASSAVVSASPVGGAGLTCLGDDGLTRLGDAPCSSRATLASRAASAIDNSSGGWEGLLLLPANRASIA
jgi:hypothetical protein